MVGEMLAGLSAFKSMYDMAKALKDINDATIRNGAVIELQEKILAAREHQTTLLERISELEKEVASFEAWETEKQRYELKEVAPGAFVQVLKEPMSGAEQNARFCANCYQNHKARLLQAHHSDALFVYHKCQECSGQIRVPTPPSSPPSLTVRRYSP